MLNDCVLFYFSCYETTHLIGSPQNPLFSFSFSSANANDLGAGLSIPVDDLILGVASTAGILTFDSATAPSAIDSASHAKLTLDTIW